MAVRLSATNCFSSLQAKGSTWTGQVNATLPFRPSNSAEFSEPAHKVSLEQLQMGWSFRFIRRLFGAMLFIGYFPFPMDRKVFKEATLTQKHCQQMPAALYFRAKLITTFFKILKDHKRLPHAITSPMTNAT